MTNGLEVGNYVIAADDSFCKIIGIEDHEKDYAQLHLITFEDDKIIQFKQRADEVKLSNNCPCNLCEHQKAALDSFNPGSV